MHLVLAQAGEDSLNDDISIPEITEKNETNINDTKKVEKGLHISMLKIIMNLIINPNTKTFDPNYVT